MPAGRDPFLRRMLIENARALAKGILKAGVRSWMPPRQSLQSGEPIRVPPGPPAAKSGVMRSGWQAG